MPGWKKETPPRLPRTNQTTVYAGWDDATYQMGWVGTTRFVVPGDGTVWDRATNLQWVQQPELMMVGAPVLPGNQILAAQGIWGAGNNYVQGDLIQNSGFPDAFYYFCVADHLSAGGNQPPIDGGAQWRQTAWPGTAVGPLPIVPATMTWAAALGYCIALDYAGYTDWRMPNAMELISLRDFGSAASPSSFTAYFPNTQATRYFSSTTRSAVVANAYTVFFSSGNVMEWWNKVAPLHNRPVRGGRTNA